MTTQQIINVGASPNDGAGDPLRTAFQKTNQNFSYLFGISGITGIANGTSNISIPIANANIVMSVGNVANVFTVRANGTTTLGNHVVTSGMNAGNITSAGTIIANGTIQSLGGITAVTITAASNLVGANLNVTNSIRTSDILITGNITSADLNITGNVIARAITGVGNLSMTGGATFGGGGSFNGNMSIVGSTSITGNTSSLFFIGNGSQLTGVTAAPANIFNIMNVTGSPLVIATSPNDTLSWTYSNNVLMTGNNSTRTLDVQVSRTPTFDTVTATSFIGDIKGSVFADDSTEVINAIDNRLTIATGNITNLTAGSLNVSGNTVLEGNLTVNGTTEYTNVTTFAVQDPIIVQGRNANNTPLVSNDGKDRGEQYYYFGGSEKSAFVGYDNSAGNMIAATDVTISGEVVSVNNWGTLQAGTVYATSNLSAVGNVNAGNLSVSGNVIGGNINASGLSLTGNVLGNLNMSANLNTQGISSVGNISASYFLGNVIGNVTGNLTVAGSNTFVVFNDNGTANSTSGFTFDKATNAVVTSGTVSAAGNITGNYILGNGALLTGVITSVANINNGTSNVTVVSSGGNVTVGVGGTGNVAVFSTVGAEISGNITGGNLLTGGLISATGSANTLNLVTRNGDANPNNSKTQIAMGFNGTTDYPQFVHTRHNAGNTLYNTIELWTSDGTQSGTFPTNAVLGLTVMAGRVSVGNSIINPGNVLDVGGDLYATGNITSTANIAGGNLSVSTGNVTLGNILNANSNLVGNIGTSSTWFNSVHANTFLGTSTTALYADLAEKYLGDAYFEPGTVVSFGGSAEVTLSNVPSDPRVAGVVSYMPAYKMNAGLEGDNAVYIALLGRVPTRVTGPVKPGDLMVSAGNGRARASAAPQIGSVIGKALETNIDGDSTIEIVVGRL